MNEDLHKVCPECSSEYRYTVAKCVDCDVPLVFPEEIARRDAQELPLSIGLVRLRTAPILWVRALAADLARAGIPYAVDRRQARDEGLLSLYVRRADRERATQFDAMYGPGDGTEEPARSAPGEGSEEPDYKVCPQCGGEYRPQIERCADCGVLLVQASELEPAEGALRDAEEGDDDQPRYDEEDRLYAELSTAVFPPPPRHEVPASDDLVCLYCGNFLFLTSFSAALDGAGIAHRIERGPYEWLEDRACIYLRPMDCAAGERLLKVAGDQAGASDRECPACGARLTHSAEICTDCGLEFLSPEAACAYCGAIVVTPSRSCPNCGHAIRDEA